MFFTVCSAFAIEIPYVFPTRTSFATKLSLHDQRLQCQLAAMEKPFVPSLTGLTEETRFWLRGSGHFWTAAMKKTRAFKTSDARPLLSLFLGMQPFSRTQDSEYSRLNDGKLRPTFQARRCLVSRKGLDSGHPRFQSQESVIPQTVWQH